MDKSALGFWRGFILGFLLVWFILAPLVLILYREYEFYQERQAIRNFEFKPTQFFNGTSWDRERDNEGK